MRIDTENTISYLISNIIYHKLSIKKYSVTLNADLLIFSSTVNKNYNFKWTSKILIAQRWNIECQSDKFHKLYFEKFKKERKFSI